jgi:hypothetical protein
MAKQTMKEYAKGWKSPEERSAAKRALRAKGKDSADAKGPAPGAWRKPPPKPKGDC